MKQPIQSFKTGELGLFQGDFSVKTKTAFASFEVPAPVCGENGVNIKDRTFR